MTEFSKPASGRISAPLTAFILFLFAIAILVAGGVAVAHFGIGLWAIAPLQGVALLLPALLYACWSGEPRLALPLGRWRARTLLPSILLLAGASAVALGMAGLFYTFLGERESERLLREALEAYSLPARILLFAAVPAFCEELFFRGAILHCLASLGRNRACLATGVLFALLHLDPLKMVPVAVLGVALALVVWESQSLWPAVAGHALHNGVVLAMAQEQTPGGVETGAAIWAAVGLLGGCGLAALWAGATFFRRRSA